MGPMEGRLIAKANESKIKMLHAGKGDLVEECGNFLLLWIEGRSCGVFRKR